MNTIITSQKATGFPVLKWEEEFLATRPMAVHEMPLPFRIDHEMAIIEQHHARIAASIRTFWGHSDCVEYIQQLVMSGGDGAGAKRVGFKPAVLSSLMNLASLHTVKAPVKPMLEL